MTCSIYLAVLLIRLAYIPILSANDVGFTPSGSLKLLEIYQARSESGPEESTAFALTYEDSTIIASIAKQNALLDEDSSGIIQKSHLFIALVGLNADCTAARRRINEIKLLHYNKYQENISPARLALSLADDAQLRSMDSSIRPLAYNALVVGSSGSTQVKPDILKVDVTGNFWKCQAASIGKFSNEIETWIKTRGIDIVAARLEAERNRTSTNNSVNCNSTYNSTAVSHESFGMSLVWKCIKEVIGFQNLGRYRIEVAECKRGGFLRGPRHFRFSKLNETRGVLRESHKISLAGQSKQHDDISVEFSLADDAESDEQDTPLWRWWNGLKRRSTVEVTTVN